MRLMVMMIVALVVGGIAGYFVADPDTQKTPAKDADTPLYWVAPMDPNYRRDEPGQSPMGMDLVPVYEDAGKSDASDGTVTISAQVQQNLGVRTETVTRGLLSPVVDAVGYVDYNEDTLVHLHPRVSGWIQTLFVTVEGERVEAGEPLYTLYAPQLVNAQKELLAALRRGDNTLIAGARARLTALGMPDHALSTLVQQREVRQAITFSAPQTGIVAALPVREGFYVEPNQNVMSIANLSEVWVDTDVFERDIPRIEEGQDVTMTVPALAGKQWQGKLDYVYPTLDSKTRTLRARLRFDNPDDLLKPGMYASVQIMAETQDAIVKVPKSAVIRLADSNRVVLVKGEGRFKSVNVTLGRSDDSHFAVTEGLKAGDTVVVSAQFLIDSESSKSSDFLRMTPPPESGHSMHSDDRDGMRSQQSMAMDDESDNDNTATVNGQLQAIDTAARTLTIHREAIEKWRRPATTMTFAVAPDIDITALEPGQQLRFTFEAGEDFVITQLDRHDTDAMEHNHD